MSTETARSRRLAGMIRFMEENIPYNRFFGLKVDEAEPGRAVIRLPWADHLVGDPIRPAVHGGAISALIDNAGGIAAFSTFTGDHERCSTIDLRVDYLGPGPTGHDLVCEATVVRRGRRVIFTRMEVWSGSRPTPGEDRSPFAIGQATYSIFNADVAVD